VYNPRGQNALHKTGLIAEKGLVSGAPSLLENDRKQLDPSMCIHILISSEKECEEEK